MTDADLLLLATTRGLMQITTSRLGHEWVSVALAEGRKITRFAGDADAAARRALSAIADLPEPEAHAWGTQGCVERLEAVLIVATQARAGHGSI
jgi:hypothetical protein